MSELRQDLVSGDWIILATERVKRLHQLLPKHKKRVSAPKSTCPFENLEKSGNWPAVALVPNTGRWRIAIIPNKYPALRQHGNICSVFCHKGPYLEASGVGRHELVITADHDKTLAHLTNEQGTELFKVLQNRYRELAKDPCLLYTLTFFNWGESAGGSVYHPHYQMLTLPIVPPDVQHSLTGSQSYFRKHRRCVQCTMLAFEQKSKTRIIAENRDTIAVAPFVSRQPFEIRVFPKRHAPYFEKTSAREIRSVAELMQEVLKKIEKNLRDPDLNFFIHTAPLKNQNQYRHYHWHIEIIPKISLRAGFELGTGVDINVVDPDAAAKLLKQ